MPREGYGVGSQDYIHRHFRGSIHLRVKDVVSLAPVDGERDLKWMEKTATENEAEHTRPKAPLTGRMRA